MSVAGKSRAPLRLLVAGFTLAFHLGAGAATPPKVAVVSAHPLATAAGIEVLDAGGNAFDAAVAVTAALAVVEPHGSGLGGGGFFLLHDARSNRQVVVDARETAPGAAVPEMFQDRKGAVVREWATDGALAAAIPGEPAALVHLAQRYGTKPLKDLLAPAIRLARDGFPVDERYRQMTRLRLETLRRFAETSRTFLARGEVPALGTIIRQPQLAESLQVIAEHGFDGFYVGTFAQRMVDAVNGAGGIWTTEDLANYRVIEREPLVANYRGARIVTVPPPSAGGIALIQMFNILDALGPLPPPGAQRDHLVVEAMRRAFMDRSVVADPAFADVPVARLLSSEHARRHALTVQRDKAGLPAPAPAGEPVQQGDHTTHFAVLDRQGNRVAATLSINLAFGSGFTVPGAGIILNNEMDDFAAAVDAANAYGLAGAPANLIAPGKRPLSSMTPAFVEYYDRMAIVGSPGGSRIPGIVLQATLALLDGEDAARALAHPRFHHQYLPDVVEAEPAWFGGAEARELRRLGHVVKSTGRDYGNAQVLMWESNSGRVSTGSDPRGVGAGIVK